MDQDLEIRLAKPQTGTTVRCTTRAGERANVQLSAAAVGAVYTAG